MEVDKSGKTAIDSKGSVEAVKFMTAFWKDSCDEGGLAWDDTNNNRAFLAARSAHAERRLDLHRGQARQDKIKDDKASPWCATSSTRACPRPGWLVELPGLLPPRGHEVRKNQKLAKDCLKWLHGKEQFGKWFQVAEGFSIGSTKMWEQAPLWNTIDEPMKGFRTAADNSRVFGYAGPPSAKATEVYSKYVIVDMFAKGVQGMKAEDAVKWAAGEWVRSTARGEEAIAGGSGGRAGLEVALPHPRTSGPSGFTRFWRASACSPASCSPPPWCCWDCSSPTPFVIGVWLSLQQRQRGQPGRVRRAAQLHQGVERLDLPHRVLQHRSLHVLGHHLQARPRNVAGLLLNRHFRGKRIIRAAMLLPFIVPTVLSTFAWRWMFDPTFSVLNWLLYQTGFITTKLPFLSDGTYGMWCAIVVNTWRGMPFFAITLLAGSRPSAPISRRRPRSTEPTAGTASGT
jgi:hypothetical protein